MKLINLDWINRDSPYLRQQHEGFRRLRFQDDLEAAFGLYHTEQHLIRMRWALLVALLMFTAFAVVDVVSLPEPVHGPITAIRLLVLGPMLLLTWLATYQSRLHPYLQWIGGACALICGLGMILIIWVARAYAVAMPYEGLVLLTLFFYCLAGLRFIMAAACGAVTFLVFMAVDLQSEQAPLLQLQHLFFLGAANLIGATGCYFMEYSSRQSFIVRNLMQELAEKDALTGVYNRRAFNQRAEASWRYAQRERRPVAVAMLDVDFFKRYNDQYGHAAGDEALRAVAKTVQQQARRSLDVTARYGGEEFSGLWYGVARDESLVLLNRLREAVEALGLEHAKSEVAAVVTISVGVAWLVPQPNLSLTQALRLADEALYQAKAQGRNRVVCFGVEADSVATK